MRSIGTPTATNNDIEMLNELDGLIAISDLTVGTAPIAQAEKADLTCNVQETESNDMKRLIQA